MPGAPDPGRRLLLTCLSLFGLLISTACGSAPPAVARVALLGDVMLGRGVSLAHAPGAPGECVPWELSLEALGGELRTADLALANLESPLAPGEAAHEMDLRAPPGALAALGAVGVDYLSLANNHRLDAGEKGQEMTVQALGEQRLGWIAPGEVVAWQGPGGLRLALLAIDDVSSDLDTAQTAAQVRKASQAGSVVVVSIHWGDEYQTAPNQRQQQIAQALVNAGADLVWGHHPHVLQPAAWLAAEDGERQGLVLYSLGNALFDQTPPDTQRSALVLATIGKQGVIEVQVTTFRIDPWRGCVRLADARTESLVEARLGLNGK